MNEPLDYSVRIVIETVPEAEHARRGVYAISIYLPISYLTLLNESGTGANYEDNARDLSEIVSSLEDALKDYCAQLRVFQMHCNLTCDDSALVPRVKSYLKAYSQPYSFEFEE